MVKYTDVNLISKKYAAKMDIEFQPKYQILTI